MGANQRPTCSGSRASYTVGRSAAPAAAPGCGGSDVTSARVAVAVR